MRLASVTSVLLLIACNGLTPFDGATPFIEGPIISRPSAQVMVVEDDRPSAPTDCARTPQIGLGSEVEVYDGGSRKDTSALTVGRRVSVFGTIGAVNSCPPHASARGVLLH